MSNGFDTSRLDYDLPESLIAQRPCEPRDAARLLVVRRVDGTLQDRLISHLPSLLSSGDLLVVNTTRVVRAKIIVKRSTGGRIPGLFLREKSRGLWEVLLRGGSRLRNGEELAFEGKRPLGTMTILEYAGLGRWTVKISPPLAAEHFLERVGRTPLPPYIHRENALPEEEELDHRRYQTTFAKYSGSVAAPTAGLHFTERLLEELRSTGIEWRGVTLHVGLGTFSPVMAQDLDDHPMHSEWYEISNETAEKIRECHERGGRVIAVGTTVVRVLETAALETGSVSARSGWTQLLIRPPYRFRVIQGLLTNFHLPRSTLLALAMAFGGEEFVRQAYHHAILSGYRFYSYGDAMLIS